MPRPRKLRKVCSLPRCSRFAPDQTFLHESVEMSIEEYETIRLIDFEGSTQEECARQMEIARTTVQAIYASARKKLAMAIVEGAPLLIRGGQYELCSDRKKCCRSCCSDR